MVPCHSFCIVLIELSLNQEGLLFLRYFFVCFSHCAGSKVHAEVMTLQNAKHRCLLLNSYECVFCSCVQLPTQQREVGCGGSPALSRLILQAQRWPSGSSEDRNLGEGLGAWPAQRHLVLLVSVGKGLYFEHISL